MRVVKLALVEGALVASLCVPVLAQAPPAGASKPQAPPVAGAPAPQGTPAGQAAPPAPKPQPAVPFPPDSKYAFVDVQAVASASQAGKDASKRLQALTEKKQTEITDKNKQLQALTTKRDTSVGVMNEAARAQIDKDVEKLQRDIQFSNSNAQAEVQELQNDLMGDFQKKLVPIIEDVAKERGLYLVLTTESGLAYVHPGLNITDEVVKRLDAKK
jgi:outer membrane protein